MLPITAINLFNRKVIYVKRMCGDCKTSGEAQKGVASDVE
jgi:hypothetical protein